MSTDGGDAAEAPPCVDNTLHLLRSGGDGDDDGGRPKPPLIRRPSQWAMTAPAERRMLCTCWSEIPPLFSILSVILLSEKFTVSLVSPSIDLGHLELQFTAHYRDRLHFSHSLTLPEINYSLWRTLHSQPEAP